MSEGDTALSILGFKKPTRKIVLTKITKCLQVNHMSVRIIFWQKRVPLDLECTFSYPSC